MERLADQIGFKFEFYEVEDKKYGSRSSNGSWTGLMGAITRGVREFESFKRQTFSAENLCVFVAVSIRERLIALKNSEEARERVRGGYWVASSSV